MSDFNHNMERDIIMHAAIHLANLQKIPLRKKSVSVRAIILDSVFLSDMLRNIKIIIAVICKITNLRSERLKSALLLQRFCLSETDLITQTDY